MFIKVHDIYESKNKVKYINAARISYFRETQVREFSGNISATEIHFLNCGNSAMYVEESAEDIFKMLSAE